MKKVARPFDRPSASLRTRLGAGSRDPGGALFYLINTSLAKRKRPSAARTLPKE